MANELDAALDAAMIATDREIAAEAWGKEADDLDDSGDRSLEEMGDGLEGQHEDDDEIGEEAGDETGEETGDETGEEAETGDQTGKEQVAKAGEQETKPAAKPGEKPGEVAEIKPAKPEGRVPAGVHRERIRAAEAERDELKAQLESEKATARKEFDELKAQFQGVLAVLQRQQPPQQQQESPKPEIVPDLFEDPKGFLDHLNRGFQTELQRRDQMLDGLRVENSMQIAHAIHKDVFTQAFAAIQKLNPQDPDSQMTVRRIYASPNPGEALVDWHKRNETLREVGNDPAAFKEKVARETREALMADPEFRRQLLAELHAEASGGDNGKPRTITRLPKSLNNIAGGASASRDNTVDLDGSEQAIAASAWR